MSPSNQKLFVAAVGASVSAITAFYILKKLRKDTSSNNCSVNEEKEPVPLNSMTNTKSDKKEKESSLLKNGSVILTSNIDEVTDSHSSSDMLTTSRLPLDSADAINQLTISRKSQSYTTDSNLIVSTSVESPCTSEKQDRSDSASHLKQSLSETDPTPHIDNNSNENVRKVTSMNMEREDIVSDAGMEDKDPSEIDSICTSDPVGFERNESSDIHIPASPVQESNITHNDKVSENTRESRLPDLDISIPSLDCLKAGSFKPNDSMIVTSSIGIFPESQSESPISVVSTNGQLYSEPVKAAAVMNSPLLDSPAIVDVQLENSSTSLDLMDVSATLSNHSPVTSNNEVIKDSITSDSSQATSSKETVENCASSQNPNPVVDSEILNSYGNAWSNGSNMDESQAPNLNLANQQSMNNVRPVEYYYDNHRLAAMYPKNMPSNGDMKRKWPQPNDGLVFVPASDGQPLVPTYLRDVVFLQTRAIPKHDPDAVAFVANNMCYLQYAPETWARVISVSDCLQFRIRTDQRDMLCEEMERRGVCNHRSNPPSTDEITKGSFWAAKLEIPKKGLVWCRVYVTKVIPPTVLDLRSKNNRNKNSKQLGQVKFMVESVDHYPAVNKKPLRAADLRHLSGHAWDAPFFDQTFYFLNVMPSDTVAYTHAAREHVLQILRKGNNFVRFSTVFRTVIDSALQYFGSLTCYTHRKNNNPQMACLDAELLSAGHAVQIYRGMSNPTYLFECCMFKLGQGFWPEDNRKSFKNLSSQGPIGPGQEYAFLLYVNGAQVQGQRGFRVPFVHRVHNTKKLGFNVSINELFNIMQQPLSFISQAEDVFKQIMNDQRGIFQLQIHAEALSTIYQVDMNNSYDAADVHLGYFYTQTQQPPIAMPKDALNFLIPDTSFNFGKNYSVENLRKPFVFESLSADE